MSFSFCIHLCLIPVSGITKHEHTSYMTIHESTQWCSCSEWVIKNKKNYEFASGQIPKAKHSWYRLRTFFKLDNYIEKIMGRCISYIKNKLLAFHMSWKYFNIFIFKNIFFYCKTKCAHFVEHFWFASQVVCWSLRSSETCLLFALTFRTQAVFSFEDRKK